MHLEATWRNTACKEQQLVLTYVPGKQASVFFSKSLFKPESARQCRYDVCKMASLCKKIFDSITNFFWRFFPDFMVLILHLYRDMSSLTYMARPD